ncbi:hypothetical protein [Wenyingzhuangia aestuarii]|uniref:hypothetical protein n=1 Tax=Wenyingzhuangia aestuarii TaxID=1647582 RepID=UPI00143A1CC9|nr:hypothetical protein [Wenyingzhuangia aestuarii]NJB82472.1 hypothetical protein [Wenyingzhuangia aestuarii]
MGHQFLKIIFFLIVSKGFTQNLNYDGAVTLDVKITLGNQNRFCQLGISAFGISNYHKIALEGGISVYTGYLFKKHSLHSKGFIGGYDVFYLLGYGQNNNLLGSSLSQYNNVILYDHQHRNAFYGIGFGFEKQFLPAYLDEFEQRIGRFMMRFASNHHSLGFSFKNDFKIGGLFYGDATDFGATGSLYINYSNAKSSEEIHQVGFALELFTPQPDYGRIANHQMNSDDGRKNVWHTIGLHKNTFYANSYLSYKLQQNSMVYQLNTGVESHKLGAYIQNKLHDGFGLNPRYPWNVAQNNGVYLQGEVQTFINSL